MKRREFITLLGAPLAWPLAARAQQGERVRRIGVLTAYSESDPEAQARVGAFREGLQKLGWTEGRNIRIDARWATSDAALMQRFAEELVALQPELILSSSRPTTAALLHQTRTIPIIFAIVADPIGSGFVASFPQPGGNVTGFTDIQPTIAGKWLERAGPRPDRTRCVQLSRVCPLCRFLKAAESRDKVLTLPELTILAFHKLLRFLDGLFLVRTFDASYC